jgi:hypothetical protein
MSKDTFEMTCGYSGNSKWRDYEEYYMTIKDPIDEHNITKQIPFDTDDMEVAKFLLTKVEGLVEVHSIQLI